jgi:hypothetical protein
MHPCKRCGRMILGVPDRSRGICGYSKMWADTGPMGFCFFYPTIESSRTLCEECDPPPRPEIGRDSNAGLAGCSYPDIVEAKSNYVNHLDHASRITSRRRGMS